MPAHSLLFSKSTKGANKSYFGLLNLLKSRIISRNIKTNLYKVLIRPVLMHGAEPWAILKSDENLLASFKRKILGRI